MKLDRRLNLVLEIEASDGSPVHIHSVPIGRAIYESTFRLITKTIVSIYSDGLSPGAGARVALMYMKDTARIMDDAYGRNPPFTRQMQALLNEVWRLTNVITIDKSGRWQTLPFQEVIDKNLLEEDTLSEVQNTITFFTCASWFHREKEREDLNTLMSVYGAQITSLDVTEYQNSLPIWKRDGSTGVTAIASPIPH